MTSVARPMELGHFLVSSPRATAPSMLIADSYRWSKGTLTLLITSYRVGRMSQQNGGASGAFTALVLLTACFILG